MSNNKHTPGPWGQYESNGTIFVSQDGADLFPVCMVFPHEGEANASLIASSPELLEALEDSERIISFALNNGMIMGRQHKHDAESHLDGIRAAIRKARGEQS